MTCARWTTLAALTALAAPVGRAAAAAPTAPKPAVATEAKDPDSLVGLGGLMLRLSQTMKGRAVIAVGEGTSHADTEWSEDELAHARTDLEKLQIISAKFSAADAPIIPFQVGKAYVLAPQTRIGVNPDLGSLSAFDVAGSDLLLADAITRLTPEQLAALGSDDGLAVASLDAGLQQSLARAFRPPLHIVAYKARTVKDDGGSERPAMSQDVVGELTEPVDWTRARIRARLRMGGVSTSTDGTYGYLDSGFKPDLVFTRSSNGSRPWQDRGVDLPIFPDVPNTFKPSDLLGAAFTQPLGLTGVRPVKEVVAGLAKVTGLTLSVWKPYQDMPVFLGSAAIPAGDVLDGLRLALTASWRKMGAGYYLAWDRMPLLAIQQAALESADAASRAVKKQRTEIGRDASWLDIANALPFEPDDPFGLTAAQRKQVFGATDAKSGQSAAAIPFGEMTTEQQKTVRTLAATAEVYVSTPGQAGPSTNRPYTDADIRSAKLAASCTVNVSLQVPGRGWVTMESDGTGLTISAGQLRRIRQDSSPETAPDPLADAPKEVRAMLEDPQPVTLPSAVRGLVVPVLGAARLNTLADEMKRHDLNVLFYPAFYGGYATFPGTPFPVDTALRGDDGLAAAVAAMKPNNIRVVAYLNTLAWQNQDDPVHWLNNHPSWLDVDVLGRGRLQWLATHVAAAPLLPGMGAMPSNFVRATEPQVGARLTGLLKALAARKDVAAVCFAAVSPGDMPDFMGRGLSAPPLGFAMADRLAAFHKTGADPADAVSYNDYVPDALRPLTGYSPPPDRSSAADARQALLARLLAQAKALRPDWRAYVLKDSLTTSDLINAASAQDKSAAKPDLVITSAFATSPTAAAGSGIVFPITRKSFFDTLADQDDMPMPKAMLDRLKSISPMVLFQTFFSSEPALQGRRVPMALYDFREAPEMITDSLKWVKAPEKAAAQGDTTR
jgi:hypothetical protein